MKTDFVSQLSAQGYAVLEPAGNQVVIEYVVNVGRNAGKKVWLGFQIGDEFPANCPSGPHFKAIDDGWVNPGNAIQNYNGFGQEWIYWSRPHPNWTATSLTVKEYMAHIRNLLLNE
ncbi:hypothetical protein GCM10007423_39250 [Dyadobacter endophyticus]|uniref:Uncharacterized protein n=1 Tax=Dyadobacter endophyticus TaxID=1749036 RepID=A0ABQ1Z064_9BACT|nr:hypothetical protein [Dyadobacter endophyticus]GGH42559.1 hypothetical protein GCM10007423_39250 [Dyadobacter endophyticus]